ncbi:SDR family oxidoreductase [Nocardioides sp. zg-579]|uniref:SDR family oxidoreductase n=1 Tax=Nocardioides marmotae TaxID=2663857 RepID=A0A6I3J964_9ACTN|nr:SDR family NAD(P)-dependent oxidoreductase [Nocardioides marmotae]MCR6030087.1 SDR family oxidoreductase [Gordonia jinghuaiqii]MTB93718.1 SDR family oxidoreductase [Nocardioides marmotae]QKE00063.1 SDR family oxidoreductase [Nocardioides marmotae]
MAASPGTAGPRVALVTGAGGGLGRAIAEGLGDAGAHVVGADLDVAGVSAASAIALDVTDPAAVDAAVAAIVEDHGRLDIVVNLAGVLRNQVIPKIVDEDFDLVLATHLKGTLHTVRAALPHMREARWGRIVNMSSIAARGSIAGGAYAAAKGAIEGFTRTAAIENAKYGITANCVAPGLIGAGMFTTVDADYQEKMTAKVPMGRLGDASDVASCVTFLSGDGASYVTGQTLTICGGLTLGI